MTINLQVQPYLADWCHSTFGNPVRLEKNGAEARLLKRFLEKWPENIPPERSEDYNLQVEIPYFKEKDPRVYNYLCKTAKYALIESFETLFLLNMRSEICSLETNCKQNTLVAAWMEKHGIDEEHELTIRKKFYRMRKQYFTNNNIKI